MLIAPRLARWATASFLFLSAALLPHTQSGASIVQHALARLETVGEGLLHWTPCFNSSAPEQTRWRCGFLDVPLDHTNASDARTARIALVMLRARNKTSKRTLFLDPGGPGASGTAYAFARSDFWETITDGNYNILGFDARGVNMSSPQVSCYEDNFNRMPWWLSASPDLSRTDPEAQFEIADSYANALMQGCRQRLGDLPRFINTVAIARDMDLIRDALGEEETNGFFLSHGTSLYITYSQLFPDRVGRVILQGVQDQPAQASMDTVLLNLIADMDATFYHGFLTNCVRSGPQRCAFASTVMGQASPEAAVAALNATYWDMIDRLIRKPLPVADLTYGAGLLTAQITLDLTALYMYSVDSLAHLASALLDLHNNNGTTIYHAYFTLVRGDQIRDKDATQGWPGVPVPKTTTFDALALTMCADASHSLPKDQAWWFNLSRTAYQVSRMGASQDLNLIFPCSHYDWNATEVFTRPLGAKLRQPMLLISSTFDPATPYRAGRRMLDQLGYDNARLVEIRGFGHGGQLPSSCFENIARAHYSHGSVPKEVHTLCMPDHLPFSDYYLRPS